MPEEEKIHKAILDAIGQVEVISELLDKHDGHYEHELDLEVTAYGRNYNGKKVGPYVSMKKYAPGEVIIQQGDWGNTFFVSVDSPVDVFVEDEQSDTEMQVAVIPPGKTFGEMAILAGEPRNATIRAQKNSPATVLEIGRPALRLLRKLKRFGSQLDEDYRDHGLKRTLVFIQQVTESRQTKQSPFTKEILDRLGKAARFMVYAKHHVLFNEGDPVDRVVFIRNGWVRRMHGLAGSGAVTSDLLVEGLTADVGVDFLGMGNCMGIEGLEEKDAYWGYTATVLQRTEVLEISIPHLLADKELRDVVVRNFSEFSLADDDPKPPTGLDKRLVAATEREIATGVVDGTNLLVMDMDLCVRCGNCSLACHQVHGHSRLLRRGIHIERPKRAGSSSTQHVLSPSVCMHCQDPECLTGCPTGAISRYENGQIDINPKTCIGCGDCATQCPYNAISMIPRKPPTPQEVTLGGRIRQWFNIAPPVPPVPVTEVDNLVATKCNLCAGTNLNPPGLEMFHPESEKLQYAFSCQENCPTGALVRVNPREYFTEVHNRIGIVFRDHTQAIGRNIHKKDLPARLWHLFGIVLTVALTAWTVWALSTYGFDRRLAEGWFFSTVRWITGFIGLTGIAVVMTYPARKQVYRRRAGPLRYWLLAHVYAGVIAGVVLLLHGGAKSGGMLTSFLMISFDLVILTGLFGIAVYLICPRIMTSIEGEPLLVEDLRARRDELREALADIGNRASPEVRDIIRRKVRPRFLTFRYLLRQYLHPEELIEALAEAREKFEAEAERLGDKPQRQLLMEAVETVVTLRRADSLIYLHQLLKLWLAPHVVATALMLVLMFVHIIQVFYFAVR